MKIIGTNSVLFRVSTAAQFGLGHISRSLAIRKHLSCKVTWFVDPDTKKDFTKLIPHSDGINEENDTGSVAELLSISAGHSSSFIICDTYQVSCEEIALAEVPTFYFSDGATCVPPDNVTMVDCQPLAKSTRNRLSGLRFMPIETRGRKQLAMDFKSLSSPISCLVGFGAVDSGNLTSLVLKALSSDKELRSSVQPVCLLGPYFKNRDTVERLLGVFKNPSIVRNYSSVLDLPDTLNIAIGAPGISHAERLFAGIPTVLVPQNDKHKALCIDWESVGCALIAQPEPDHIVRQVKKLIANQFEIAREISVEGQRQIDGDGALRVVSELNARWRRAIKK